MMRSCFGVLLSTCLVAACSSTTFVTNSALECTDSQCGWQVEQGEIALVGTWDKADLAVSMLDAPTAISRTVGDVYLSSTCMAFSYLGDIEEAAQVELRIDFNDDGSEDVVAPLVAAHWERAEVRVRAPRDYRAVRVRLVKSGSGRAALARSTFGSAFGCESLPETVLADGAECTNDVTCRSGRCVTGRCASCDAGGCSEGQGCRNSGECLDGACAAGICRACAKQGSCAQDERCSSADQCGSDACVHGSRPGSVIYPGVDGFCGECRIDADCATSHCMLGRCAVCGSDADCGSGLACRFLDPFEAQTRGCAPRPAAPLPRGALCEGDAECANGLRCGAAPGRAKRCGIACAVDTDCNPTETCAAPFVIDWYGEAGQVWTDPGAPVPTGRIATCYAQVPQGGACEEHIQCRGVNRLCCDGVCGVGSLDLSTADCRSL